MLKTYPNNYLISTMIMCIVMGFILLISVILLHDYINQNSGSIMHRSAAVASQASAGPVPDQIINEIVHSSKNISPYPTTYPENASFSVRKLYEMNHPTV